MKRFKILFINFLLVFTSRAKSIKESAINNEFKSHAVKLPLSGQENDKETITIYIKNDDILSISEFSKIYNPEEHHLINFRFIKEIDSDYVKKIKPENNETRLDVLKVQESIEENKTDRSVNAIAIDATEESRISNTEEPSTETREIETTTISVNDQDKDDEVIEVYTDYIEAPEDIESTEGYFNIDANSDRLDDIVPPIPSRRSLFQNDLLLLENKGRISNTPVETIKVDENTVPKSENINSKDTNEQRNVESNAWTPFVASAPYPVISHQKPDQPSNPSIRQTFPTDLRDQKNTNFGVVKVTPDEYEPNSNLDKSGQIWTNEHSIDDFNSNVYENAYPYTPSNDKNIIQHPVMDGPNFNSVYSKLTQASEHPLINRGNSDESFVNYGPIRPNFNLNNPYLQNVGAYNFRPRPRGFLYCKNCGHY